MKNIVFIGSHLGYDMDKTPLGGGAMVGLNLIRHWPARDDFGVTVLGSGPVSPDPRFTYVRLGMPAPDETGADPTAFSEAQYARFCRRFEAATTRWILSQRAFYAPANTCLIVNDIAEAPDLKELAEQGYPIISLWHVDVVDYVSRIYLRRWIAPQGLARFYERLSGLGASRFLPDVLRVIFQKQKESVAYSRQVIVPSRPMARMAENCYGPLANRPVVLPWGMWAETVPEGAIAAGAEKLRGHYQIGPETAVLMTLSRISPEKGLHLLLRALKILEAQPRWQNHDVCLFICGEPAFMRGRSYAAQVRREAARLTRFRVFFPGYLTSLEKKFFLRLAHLFVSPSIHESYGLTVLEAMRSGVAVLSSDHYGANDMPADVGRAVPYARLRKAPALMARALDELLSDPARLREMGARAGRAVAPFNKTAGEILDRALGMIGS